MYPHDSLPCCATTHALQRWFLPLVKNFYLSQWPFACLLAIVWPIYCSSFLLWSSMWELTYFSALPWHHLCFCHSVTNSWLCSCLWPSQWAIYWSASVLVACERALHQVVLLPFESIIIPNFSLCYVGVAYLSSGPAFRSSSGRSPYPVLPVSLSQLTYYFAYFLVAHGIHLPHGHLVTHIWLYCCWGHPGPTWLCSCLWAFHWPINGSILSLEPFIGQSIALPLSWYKAWWSPCLVARSCRMVTLRLCSCLAAIPQPFPVLIPLLSRHWPICRSIFLLVARLSSYAS